MVDSLMIYNLIGVVVSIISTRHYLKDKRSMDYSEIPLLVITSLVLVFIWPIIFLRLDKNNDYK